MHPGKVQYATQISSPATGVQPITFIFDTFEDLKNSLKEAETAINTEQVELTFHKARIQTYESKIDQHKARVVQIEAGEKDEEAEAIPMEEV